MLGEVQSGHLAAVGFDLYTELVAEAVHELRGTAPEVEEPSEVRIDLAITAHLPEDYVTDQPARLEAYRRLASAATQAEVDDPPPSIPMKGPYLTDYVAFALCDQRRHGMTARQISDRCDLSESTISMFLSAKRNLSGESIDRLVWALGMKLVWANGEPVKVK